MLPSGLMDALRYCGETGCLYSRIQSYIGIVLDTTTTPAGGGGGGGGGAEGRVVPRELVSALTNKLKSYHSLLADLEQDLALQSLPPLPPPLSANPGDIKSLAGTPISRD